MMGMNVSKFIKWFLLSIVVFIMIGCGGGSSGEGSNGSSSGNNNAATAQATMNENVKIIEKNDSDDIVINSNFEDENTNLTVSKKLAASLKIGDIFYLPSDINSNYPFGMAGKVESIRDNDIELSKVTYADILRLDKSLAKSNIR